MTIDQKHVFEYEETYSEKSYQRFKRSYIPKGATGVVTIGTVGEKMFQAHEDCFTNQSVNCIISDDKYFDKDYIFYLMKLNLPKVAGANPGTASGRHHVSKSNFSSIKVDVTKDLSIQKKIAKILSNYDDLIENNLKRIKLLEESARLTYEEWFLRFRIDGEKLEIDSETGLPFGWKKRKLDDICDVSSSKRIFLSDYVDNGVAFYRGKEITIKSQNKSISNEYFISQERFEEINKRFGSPKKDDILVSAVGTLGSIYLVKESDGEFYFKDGNLIWLKEFTKEDNLYIYYSLKGKRLQANISGVAIGSSQKALTIQALKSVEVPYPNNDVIDNFNNKIRPKVNEIENLINQNELLKEARDILLPRLMTGMIDVEDIEVPV